MSHTKARSSRSHIKIAGSKQRERVTEEEREAWGTPRCFSVNSGYSELKTPSVVGAERESGFVVMLHSQTQARSSHALLEVKDLAQKILYEHGADEAEAAVDGGNYVAGIIIVDFKPLEEVLAAMNKEEGAKMRVDKELDYEGKMPTLCKELGKPAARLLEKLLLRDATIVAHYGMAQLALKLIRFMKPGCVRRVILVHPRLPTETLRMLATSGMPADAGAAPRLDVVFQSAASQAALLPMLRRVFPVGAHTVAQGPTDSLLHSALVASETIIPPAVPLASCDFDAIDTRGYSLWFAQLDFMPDTRTKQNLLEIENVTGSFVELVEEEAELEPEPAPARDENVHGVLSRFYAKYAPEKTAADVDGIIAKRISTGEDWFAFLCDKLQAKYGEHPSVFALVQAPESDDDDL